jgi:hypothetical protein
MSFGGYRSRFTEQVLQIAISEAVESELAMIDRFEQSMVIGCLRREPRNRRRSKPDTTP